MRFEKAVDETDTAHSFTSDSRISSDTVHAEMQSNCVGESKIEVGLSDNALRLGLGNDISQIKIGWFEDAQELRQLADFLHKQANIYEAWQAYCDEISEEFENGETKGAEWLEENAMQAPEFWEEQND